MKKMIQEFSSNQTMLGSSIELFHYQDVRFGKVPPHIHNHYEFYFFLEGKATYFIENRQYNLEKGDFLMIPPNILHFPEVMPSIDTTPYDRIVVWLNTEYYDKMTAFDPSLREMLDSVFIHKNWHFRPTTEDFQKIREILSAMVEEQVNQKLSYLASIESYCLQLLVFMNRITQHKSSFQRDYPTKDLYSNIIHYIHKNIKTQLPIEQITTEFFISKSYLSKIFREHLGISVHQYILRIKTDKILEEVKKGRTFSEASYEYGFENYSSFYRRCMREFHTSPKNLNL